jgi:DNA-directed RNA polymerase subunit RPC12/RpoP
MPYKCLRCGRKFDRLPVPLACTCGYRILVKARPEGMVKRVRAV